MAHRRRLLAWTIFACVLVLPLAADATGNVSALQRSHLNALTGQLRSAYLLRAAGVDRLPRSRGTVERQARLIRHFHAVLTLLTENAEASLEVALDRLESHRHEDWTREERASWRARLAEQRLINLQRLYRYQRRGVFPINEHVGDRAVPVFVDDYDTACAVGHLMRESGWESVVAHIAETNNLVYVTDEGDSPIANWALTSGLTLEEAALIQPAYEPPPFNGNLAQLTVGGSVMTDDLQYKNFRIGRGASETDALVSYFLNTTNDPNYLGNLGVAVGDYLHVSEGNGTSMNTLHDEWTFIGAGWIGGMASLQQSPAQQWVMLSYDVTVKKGSHFITAAALESFANFNGNYLFQGPPGAISMTSRIMRQGTDGILAPGSSLATLQLSSTGGPQFGPFLDGVDNAPLAPRQGLTVSTIIQLTGPGDVSSFINSFEVIPEPASMTLAGMGIAAILSVRRRRG